MSLHFEIVGRLVYTKRERFVRRRAVNQKKKWRCNVGVLLLPLSERRYVWNLLVSIPPQEETYKKTLLLSRKEKKDMGFEVNLK